MTCIGPNHDAAEGWVDGIKGVLDAAGGGAGIPNLIAKATKGVISGETVDISYKDYADASGLTDLRGMANFQKGVNAGKTVGAAAKRIGGSASDAYNDLKDPIEKRINDVRNRPPCDEEPPEDPVAPSYDPTRSPQGPSRYNPYDPRNPNDPQHPGREPSNPGWPSGNGGGGGNPVSVDPLVIDLDLDGVELMSIVGSAIHFDFNGDGFAEQTGWVRPDDGLLVLDRNSNGSIDNGAELFGGPNIDGFDALRQLDSNGDSVFNSQDSDYGLVAIWRDLNSNGISEVGELVSLQSAGVTSISLDVNIIGEARQGNWIAGRSQAGFANGATAAVESVYFSVNPTLTRYEVPDGFQFVDAAYVLPELRGYGTVRDLSVAISEDPLLLQTVRNLVLNSDGISAASLRTQVIALVDQWVGVNGSQADRGPYADYDKIAVVEAFRGQQFGSDQLTPGEAQALTSSYNAIIDGLMGRLVVQLSNSYFNLAVLEGRTVPIFEHSLSPYSVFYYDPETDRIDGRPDLFLVDATARLTGSPSDQLKELEALLDFTPSVSIVLFNGFRGTLEQQLVGMLEPALNFSTALGDSAVLLAMEKDVVFGTSSDDAASPAALSPTAYFGLEGNDEFHGSGGQDLLTGGAGNDRLTGGAGADTYVFNRGDGQDVINDSDGFEGGGDQVQLGTEILPTQVIVSQAADGRHLILSLVGSADQVTLENDINSVYSRVEQVRFADGTVWSHAELMSRSMTPTAGDDVFYGSFDGEMISGSAGDDWLDARGGNDTLIGGTGNDTLIGSSGADTYVFNRGDGQDIVNDSDGFEGGGDTLSFGTGVLPGEVSVAQSADGLSLILSIAGTTDRVTLYNDVNSPYGRIEQVRFADGTVWLHADLMNRSTTPTPGNDVFYGGLDGETLSGGAGDDRLDARGGNDMLIGGTGNDTLIGSSGADTYVFNRGDGQDLVNDSDGFEGGGDKVRFGSGILPSEVQVTQSVDGKSLILTITGSNDKITLENTLTSWYSRIELVEFANGTVWQQDELVGRSFNATDGNDVINGDGANNTLQGLGGDDHIDARGGNDTLAGGTGNDTLIGSSGADTYVFNRGDGQDIVHDSDGFEGGGDTLSFGAGVLPGEVSVAQSADGLSLILSITGTDDRVTLNNDINSPYGRIEQVRFADGSVWSHSELMTRSTTPTSSDDVFYGSFDVETISGGAGDDRIEARGGDDTLIGGAGNDTLSGHNGADTYLFNRGDGQDIIDDADGWEGGGDRLRFDASISPSEVRVTQGSNGRDFILTIAGTDDRITLRNAITSPYSHIEQVTFADGTVWNSTELMARSLQGTPGDDYLIGDAASTVVTGLAGDDVLDPRAGNDRVLGGAGYDTILESEGDDVYVWNLGDEHDRITAGDWWDGVNTLEFGSGISPADIIYSYYGADIRLSVRGHPGSVTLEGQRNSTEGVDFFRFSNGTVWTRAELLANSTFDGTIYGTPRADALYGTDGNDTFDGGRGDDYLGSGPGSDTYIYRSGDGTDVIDDESPSTTEVDTLRLVDLNSSDVELTRNGVHSLLKVLSTGEVITLDDQFWSENHWGIDRIEFANGEIWDRAAIRAASWIRGTEGPDTFNGTAGSDAFDGAGGDDIFNFSQGSDAYKGGSGIDTLNVSGVFGSAIINLSAASNQLSAEGFFSQVQSIENIAGSGFDDTLTGDAGANRIDGYVGNDTIAGGGGADVLLGGFGNDTFKIGPGDSELVSIDGGEGTDTIQATGNGTVIRMASMISIEAISAAGFFNVQITGTTSSDNFNGLSLTGISRIDGLAGNDTFTGGAAAEIFYGGEGADTITGGAGDDTLFGDDGDDLFKVSGTGSGFDAVDGGTGTDTLQATAANTIIGLRSAVGLETITAAGFSGVYISGTTAADLMDFSGTSLIGITKIDAGAGNDTVSGSAGNDTIIGGAGDDVLSGGNGADTFQVNATGSGIDAVDGGAGSDTIQATVAGAIIGLSALTGIEVITAGSLTGVSISGSANADMLDFSNVTLTAITKIDAGAGDDVISGSAANDTIIGGTGNDTLAGGAGNDTFQVSGTTGGYDAVDGGLGTDTIQAMAANTVIGLRSLAGIETITAGSLAGVYISGTSADETLNFLSVTLTGITRVEGGGGNDIITGNGVANTIWGGIGNDTLSSDAGNDIINGDDGDDVLIGGLGNDTLGGGAGTDTVDYSSATTAWTINLSAASSQAVSGKETDTISGVENVIGGAGADIITGTSGNNNLQGGANNDRITGGAGNDTINGGAGTDVAVFAGLQASYSIVTSSGSIQVIDNQTTTDGNDGTDTLIGVERAEFKGGVQVALAAPIMLDLDGNGVQLIGRADSKARFDWDGDGTRDETGWVGEGDGILVFDRNGDNNVSGAEELSFLNDKPGARSDLDGLRAFDTNADGAFSSADGDWGSFRIWLDVNGDGTSQAGELLSMEAAGIASISLTGTATAREWGWGENIIVNEGTFARTDGTTGSLADVALSYAQPASGGLRDIIPVAGELLTDLNDPLGKVRALLTAGQGWGGQPGAGGESLVWGSNGWAETDGGYGAVPGLVIPVTNPSMLLSAGTEFFV